MVVDVGGALVLRRCRFANTGDVQDALLPIATRPWRSVYHVLDARLPGPSVDCRAQVGPATERLVCPWSVGQRRHSASRSLRSLGRRQGEATLRRECYLINIFSIEVRGDKCGNVMTAEYYRKVWVGHVNQLSFCWFYRCKSNNSLLRPALLITPHLRNICIFLLVSPLTHPLPPRTYLCRVLERGKIDTCVSRLEYCGTFCEHKHRAHYK